MERLRTRRLEALADGIMECAVLRRMEITRPAGEHSAEWARFQARMVERGLDALEREATRFAARAAGEIEVAQRLARRDAEVEWLRGPDAKLEP